MAGSKYERTSRHSHIDNIRVQGEFVQGCIHLSIVPHAHHPSPLTSRARSQHVFTEAVAVDRIHLRKIACHVTSPARYLLPPPSPLSQVKGIRQEVEGSQGKE